MSKFLSLIVIGILLCVPIISEALTLTDTPAGSRITNAAKAKYTNSGGTSYSNSYGITNTVKAIYGISFFSGYTGTSQLPASPNQPTYHTVKVANEGNTNITITLSTQGFRYGGSYGTAWTALFYEDANNDGSPDAGSINQLVLQEDATNWFLMAITPSATAEDNSVGTNRLRANFALSGTFSKHAAYTGLNSTVYGGTNWLSRLTITIVQGPIIALLKSARATNSASYIALGGGPNDIVPGAEIVYAINWTNSGSGDAYNFRISDPVDGDVAYVAGTMRYRDNIRQTANQANWSAANPLLDGFPNDGLGVYSIEGINGATMQFNYANPITSGASGTVFFKVQVR